MKQISKIIVLGILVAITSCVNTQTVAPVCNTSNTEFQQIKASALASGLVQDYLTTCEEKQIYFTVNATKTICKIGFFGNDSAYVNNIPYQIKIFNMAGAGSQLYSNAQIMSPIGEYHDITTPLTVTPGNVYMVAVKLASMPTPYHNSFYYLKNSSGAIINFPMSSNGVNIVSSFMGYGTNCTSLGGDYELPWIDVVFN